MGIASLIILVFFVPYVASGLRRSASWFNSLFGWNYMLRDRGRHRHQLYFRGRL